MNSFLRLLPILVLLLFAINISSGVSAQGLDETQFAQTGNNNLTALVGPNSSLSLPKVDGRWVLPLVLVGIGVLLLGGSRERVDRRYYSPSRDITVAFHDIRGETKRKKDQLSRLKKPLRS